jgi:xylulokinase
MPPGIRERDLGEEKVTPMLCVLGLDLGTSAVKALLMSETGAVVASADAQYPLLTPRPNWAEQDPESWWEGTVTAVRSCLARARSAGIEPDVAAAGLSGQMHGSVFLDGSGRVLRPAILWNDQRTGAQCREITETVGADRLIKLTFNKALTGFTAPKILWLRDHEPDLYARVEQVLLPKDYLRYRMTGRFATEVSDASGTLLFDVAGRRWSGEMLKALEIPERWLPECFESVEVSASLSPEAARQLGLPESIPVAGGGGDQAAGAVGSGIVEPGRCSCVFGTSGVVFWHADEPVFDPIGRLHSFCHAVPNKWHLMGVTLSAGGSMRWFRDSLCSDLVEEAKQSGADPYEMITRLAAEAPPGAEGLIFLPYLAGERTPHADAYARGAFLGLSLRHTRAHMARAVMEGVCMSLLDCLELGRELGLVTSRVYLSGGGARSSMWRQMAADIFGVETARINIEEGPAYGAALLAAVAAGLFSGVDQACRSFIRVVDLHRPDPARQELYRQLYRLYRPLYARLKDFYNESAALVAQYP